MKVKYLNAGDFIGYQHQYLPTMANAGPATETTTSTSSGSNKSDSDKTLDNLMSKVMDNALPNEMIPLARLYRIYKEAPSLALEEKIIVMATQVMDNHKMAGIADTAVKESGAAGEIAQQGGYVWARSRKDNEIQLITLDALEKDLKREKRKYSVLTNEQLSMARRNDDRLKFDNTALSALRESVSPKTISDYIEGVVSKLGTEKTGGEVSGSTVLGIINEYMGKYGAGGASKPSSEELKGFQTMVEIYQREGNNIDPAQMYKYASSSEREHLNEAFEYLYRSMPTNMKNALAVQHVMSGGSAKDAYSQAGAIKLLQDALTTQTNYEFTVDATGTGRSSGEGSTTGMKNMSTLQTFVDPNLNRRNWSFTFESDPSHQITLNGNVSWSLPTTSNDKNFVGPTNVRDALDGGLGTVADTDHMFFGDQKITAGDMEKLVYDGNNAVVAYVPVNGKGDPDFEALKALTRVQTMIESAAQKGEQLTPEAVRTAYQNEGIPTTMDNSGQIVPNLRMERFMVMTANSTEKWFDADDNDLMEQLTGTANDAAEDTYYSTMDAYDKAHGTDVRDVADGMWWYDSDIVRAPLFIKVPENATLTAATVTDRGARVLPPTYEQTAVIQDQQNRRQQQFTNLSSAALFPQQ
jgi:hypothetical protein